MWERRRKRKREQINQHYASFAPARTREERKGQSAVNVDLNHHVDARIINKET